MTKEEQLAQLKHDSERLTNEFVEISKQLVDDYTNTELIERCNEILVSRSKKWKEYKELENPYNRLP